jgi:histone H1/5
MPFSDVSTYNILWSDVVLIESGALGEAMAPMKEKQLSKVKVVRYVARLETADGGRQTAEGDEPKAKAKKKTAVKHKAAAKKAPAKKAAAKAKPAAKVAAKKSPAKKSAPKKKGK